MTEETKQQLKQLDEQIAKLVDQYFQLVSPTNEEMSDAAEGLNDDRREAVDILTDPNNVFGKYYLASDAAEMREDTEAEGEPITWKGRQS